MQNSAQEDEWKGPETVERQDQTTSLQMMQLQVLKCKCRCFTPTFVHKVGCTGRATINGNEVKRTMKHPSVIALCPPALPIRPRRHCAGFEEQCPEIIDPDS